VNIFIFSFKQLCADFLNLQGGKKLPVTILHLIALTSFFLENEDFLRLPLLGNPGDNLGILQNRTANLGIFTINDHQDIIQLNDIPNIAIYFLYSQLVSTSYLILLSTGTYYRIHYLFLFGKNLNTKPFVTTRNGYKNTFSQQMSIFFITLFSF